MRARKIGAAALAALAVGAAPAAAHDLDGEVSCTAATFVYSDNASGDQSSTETVRVDGVIVYGPAERRWRTTSRRDTFSVAVTVEPGPHVVSGTASFRGSDGYRYTRTWTRAVDCPAPPPPPPPPPVDPPAPPAPPVTPPAPVDPPPPAPPAPTPPVKPTPPKPVKPLPRPTVCRVYAERPANAITRGIPRPGQIRVRFVPGRGWVGFRRDRFVVVRVSGRDRVLFVPGFFCGPRPTLEVTG